MDQLKRIVDERIDAHRNEWPGHRAAIEIRTWADLIDDVKDELQRAVDRAREAGATWQDIGEALGVTRATAHQRFGKNKR